MRRNPVRRIAAVSAVLMLSAAMLFAADSAELYQKFSDAVDNGDVREAVEVYTDLLETSQKEYTKAQRSYEKALDAGNRAKAQSAYNDMRNKDLNDVYDELMQDVNDIWDMADDAAANDDFITEASQNFSANSLAQQADNNYQDPEMQKLQYDQTEANLVYQAQQLMSTYEQAGYNLSYLQNTKSLLETQYNIVQAQRNVGMATDTDVLNAQKSVQDQEASILSAQKSADNVHRQLCLMLGWQADAQPEIKPLPEPDLSRINAMNPSADLAKAVANNYDVRYNTKKKDNVTTQELKESAQATIDNAADTVARSLNSQYNTVLTARDALNTAQSQLVLAQTNLNTAAAQLAVGTITQAEYQSSENSLQSAENGVRSAKLQLQLAMDAYDWIVNGLTLSN